MPPWLLLGHVHMDGDIAEDNTFLLTPPRVARFTLSMCLFSSGTMWPPYIIVSNDLGQCLLAACPCSPSRLAALHPEEDMLGLPFSSTPQYLSSSSPPPAADASSLPFLASRAPPDAPLCELVLCDLYTSGMFSICTDGVHAPNTHMVSIITVPGVENFVLAELQCNATLLGSNATCSLRRYG
jgi:hypothetical protein